MFDAVYRNPIKFNEREWHGAFMDVASTCRSLRGSPKTDLPDHIYRQSPCGGRRTNIVRLMHKKNILTGTRLQEC